MLSVRSLNAYYGQAHILSDLSLEAKSGEVVVLLGRNGAGKTTALKSIVGLVPPASGEVWYRGGRIDGLQPFQIAQLGLGYVPEDRRVFTDLTVLENLEVGRQRARPGLPSWSIRDVFELFPNLAETTGRPASQMSGGEQQMLSIARTLMGNPACILLDEPSEGLAPVIVDQMAVAIRRMKSDGLCVLLSEQNLHFAAEVADRAYIVEQGRIRFDGTMAELNADGGVSGAYLAI